MRSNFRRSNTKLLTKLRRYGFSLSHSYQVSFLRNDNIFELTPSPKGSNNRKVIEARCAFTTSCKSFRSNPLTAMLRSRLSRFSQTKFRSIAAHSYGFTLAELIITIAVLGVVSAIVIPNITQRTINKQNAVKLIQVYSSLSNAIDMYMIENNCVGNLASCVSNMNDAHKNYQYKGFNQTPDNFKDIKNHLNVVDESCYNTEKSWLSSTSVKMLDGSKQVYAWEAPAVPKKNGKRQWDGQKGANCYYLLRNGAVIHVQLLDDNRQSGFGSIDVNGKKGPNEYGVDVFPFGIGAAFNSNHWASKSLNPFWAEDNNSDNSKFNNGRGKTYKGMCRISCNNCDCPVDETSPTAYVLKYKKIPRK